MFKMIISTFIGVILGNIIFNIIEGRCKSMACGKGKKKK